jgi:hypothetical protein
MSERAETVDHPSFILTHIHTLAAYMKRISHVLARLAGSNSRRNPDETLEEAGGGSIPPWDMVMGDDATFYASLIMIMDSDATCIFGL